MGPPSVSRVTASASKPFAVPIVRPPARVGSSRPFGENHDAVARWRKDVMAGAKPDALSPRKRTFGAIDTNSPLRERPPIAINRAAPAQFIHNPSASIPRVPLQPDVFHDAGKDADASTAQLKTASAGRKRGREPSNPTAAKRSKTVHSEEHARRLKQEEEMWQTKWLKAFPTLVFYFDPGVDDHTIRQLRLRVQKMGAHVDQFFSQKVSHLIVKSTGSPQKPKPLAPSRRVDAIRESPRNPFQEGGVTPNLASKAEAMGMKVWGVKKLSEMLERLAPASRHVAEDSLHTLLEEERLHGTRERDLMAPRPGYHYFKPADKYILIEDAIGKHRPIMVKEYGPPGKDGPEWPVPYQTFLRVPATSQTDTPVDKLQARAWALYVDRIPFEGEQPPGELRRSTSMRNISGTPRLPDTRPYQNASGNSVVITSNIASTSTAHPSPFTNGLPTLGAGKDRAIMQMSKRVQVLKGNARLAAARRPQPDDIFAIPQRRASTGQPPQQKTFMTQGQLIRMLQQAREPVREEAVSKEMRIANRQRVDAQGRTKDQDAAPGYCENCRLRYTDLSVHLRSKKHRRFAHTASNFAELDKLLDTLNRPLNPNFCKLDFPPCRDRHRKDIFCSLCTAQGDSNNSESLGSDTETPRSQDDAESPQTGDEDFDSQDEDVNCDGDMEAGGEDEAVEQDWDEESEDWDGEHSEDDLVTLLALGAAQGDSHSDGRSDF